MLSRNFLETNSFSFLAVTWRTTFVLARPPLSMATTAVLLLYGSCPISFSLFAGLPPT